MMTPGAYLSLRRKAAGLHRGEAAALIASSRETLPIYTITQYHARIALLCAMLDKVETDRGYLSPDQASIVQKSFPFDTGVYEQLLMRHIDGPGSGLPEPRLCAACACSWSTPCATATGPCEWSEADASLCTACEAQAHPHPHAHHPRQPMEHTL